MTRNLIIQSADGAHLKYLDVAEPIHRAYADRCGADYLAHRGRVDPTVHPAWNRLPLMLDAFEQGYEKVVWLDTDTLVVDPTRSIFDATPDRIAILMKRAYVPWADRIDCWNDGVLVANNTVDGRFALEWTWDHRHEPFLPHHVAGMWELNWLNDWAAARPHLVEYLDPRWNWMPLDMAYSAAEAYILGWHGMPADHRWREFSTAVSVLLDGGRPVGAGELL